MKLKAYKDIIDLQKKVDFFACLPPSVVGLCVRLPEFHLTFVHLVTGFNSEKPVAAPKAHSLEPTSYSVLEEQQWYAIVHPIWTEPVS